MICPPETFRLEATAAKKENACANAITISLDDPNPVSGYNLSAPKKKKSHSKTTFKFKYNLGRQSNQLVVLVRDKKHVKTTSQTSFLYLTNSKNRAFTGENEDEGG